MLRKNFRESSGVIVDVCAAHGVWFDRGELGTIIDFAASGAMAKAERDSAERADSRRRLDEWGAELRSVGPRHYIGLGRAMLGPIDALADIARVIPGLDPDDD